MAKANTRLPIMVYCTIVEITREKPDRISRREIFRRAPRPPLLYFSFSLFLSLFSYRTDARIDLRVFSRGNID